MDLDSISTAVKWVLLILLAGFIAQFGKRFADRVIEKRRKNKTGFPPPLSLESSPSDRDGEATLGGKTSLAESPALPGDQAATGELAAKAAKKAAKTWFKQGKKEAKASAKSASRNGG